MRTVAEMRELRAPSVTVGLVATMGALHEGHLSILRHARAECDQLVMSLFVNPTQFDDGEDLKRYPRDEQRDARLAAEVGVDVLFAPRVDEMYPDGFATSVRVAGVSERLEGVSRGPEHFAGVTTVVTKLLNIVAPDVAYFGQKDAQQVLVIERLVRDLEIPVRIAVCPTAREPDGLARSSRNALLEAAERAQAAAIPRALAAAAASIAGGERDALSAVAAAREVLRREAIEPEYLELVDPRTLEPVRVVREPVLVALAARVGRARLIDNMLARPGS